jgi:hypothetical protein
MTGKTKHQSWIGPHRASAMLFCLALGLSLLTTRGLAQVGTLKEYDLKAAFLYNVAKYTDWPASAFVKPNDPIIIGVLGNDPFGETLDRIVRDRIINGHPLRVRRASGVAELKGAHLVFISPSETSQVAQHCAAIEKFHALTIGDTAESAPFTTVNFAFDNGKIVFSVDLDRASDAGVNISSNLLRLAKLVIRHDPTISE